MSYSRNIKFTTSQAEEEILDITSVKEVIMDMISCKNNEQYNIMKKEGITMSVIIFTKDNRIKINNETYNDLIDNFIYSTDDYVKIQSIKAEDIITDGIISLKMRGN